MKNANHITSRLIYPFPFLKNPLAEQAQKHIEDVLIDIEYLEMGYPENIRDVYKRTKTARISGWWYPTASYDRLLHLSRFMTWTMANDDIFEQRSEARIREIAEAAVNVLKGRIEPHETDYILAGQLYRLRHGLLQSMSPAAVDHFADAVNIYLDGLAEESKYRNGGVWPTIEELIRIRNKSICMRPFYALIPVEMRLELPAGIISHPHIMKLESVASDIIARYNDGESYFKDVDNPEGLYLNLIEALKHHYNYDQETAINEVIRFSDESVKEFLDLQSTLPDFGDEWNEHVANYVNYLAMTVSGWKRVSFYEMDRYTSGGWAPSLDFLALEDSYRQRWQIPAAVNV